jgi:hypothetical protein
VVAYEGCSVSQCCGSRGLTHIPNDITPIA